MNARILCLLLFALLLTAACTKEADIHIPPRPRTAGEKASGSRQAIHTGTPHLGGQAVRDWFATVRFPGWRRLSIFSEFHPDEGSFVARYGKGQKVLYLSYIDNERMSQFGLRRNAREMLQVGRSGTPQSSTIQGRTWYGVQDSRPLLALDVNDDVKLVLMGYTDLELAELEALARELPVQELEDKAGR